MSWILSWPWAALGLIAVPALVVIYLLRQRSAEHFVSSLILWRGEPPLREGGHRVDRFRAPPLFWLELLILLLLVAAALGPLIPTRDSRRPLVVVLDDSFSMRAGTVSSPRHRAREALASELVKPRHGEIRLLLAGQEALPLGEGALDAAAALAALGEWRAVAPTADLEGALGLAFDLGGPRARLLVVSDQAPPSALAEPRLEWWAFGRPQPNLALVGASRRRTDSTEATATLLAEVANFSSKASSAKLSIRLGDDTTPAETLALRLAAGETGRFRFTVPASAEAYLELSEDVLPFDDRAVLLPEVSRPVRTAVAIDDADYAELVRNTLAATGRVRVVGADEPAELVVATRPPSPERDPGAWWLHLRRQEPAKPYLGPFVLDRGHPLTEGLSLGGVIWAAGDPAAGDPAAAAASDSRSPGRAVLSAGDVPLVVDHEKDAVHDLELRFEPRLSTLQRTPSWPVLWWNLLAWRTGEAPGLRVTNARLAEPVTLRLPQGEEEVSWRPPGGGERSVVAVGGVVRLLPREPGVHEIRSGEWSGRFAVNVLAADESNLSDAAGGHWGDWDASGDDAGSLWGLRGVGWAFALAALALLLLHMARTAPRGKESA